MLLMHLKVKIVSMFVLKDFIDFVRRRFLFKLSKHSMYSNKKLATFFTNMKINITFHNYSLTFKNIAAKQGALVCFSFVLSYRS